MAVVGYANGVASIKRFTVMFNNFHVSNENCSDDCDLFPARSGSSAALIRNASASLGFSAAALGISAASVEIPAANNAEYGVPGANYHVPGGNFGISAGGRSRWGPLLREGIRGAASPG